MKKVIPRIQEIYCDRCGVKCLCDENYRHNTELTAQWKEYDIYRSLVLLPVKTYDLCDECLVLFVKFMNNK